MTLSLNTKALVLSLTILIVFLLGWHLWVEAQKGPGVDMDPAYAELLGIQAKGGSAMPGPLEVGQEIFNHLADPFYDKGPNDKGIGIQLAYSIARVLIGFFLAALVAIPIGFFIGMSPVFSKAMDPFVQILKPVSPLA
ncbi:MAG: nitrate ABC transporter, permease protein, partial [Pseudomonadota bacterium]